MNQSINQINLHFTFKAIDPVSHSVLDDILEYPLGIIEGYHSGVDVVLQFNI